MKLQQTSRLELAAHFINSTGSHVFLTGKAGTGKTTFLRQLAEKTHKSFLVVAPTGIAALNAGGVTIHSQFLLPFGSFLPAQEAPGTFSENVPLFTRQTLTRTHTLNSSRIKVLRATELLIIDEVSMLRADILDAIDFRMRRAKGDQSRSFGGAQVLFIGDLHQLPPIVKEEEWQILQRYYRSMHFFEALALRKDPPVYLELDKIFRQEDDRFIQVLNRLRDNCPTPADIALLNSHYHTTAVSGREEPIILTTHNRTADRINADRMEALPGSSSFFDAEVNDDFPEKLYPLPERIELKPGAQLMFIRNDSDEEKAYVNGSLAMVEWIRDGEVCVKMQDGGSEYMLKQETWENKKYILNEDRNEVEEEVTGTFSQYPVKPAWAVTVHKSQGLTFDRAVIDVGQAFAPGQVYVALSRLRSLEGLTLRTRINASSLMSDAAVNAFTRDMEGQKPLPEVLRLSQFRYLEQVLMDTFDFRGLTWHLERLKKSQSDKMEFADEEMRTAMQRLKQRIDAEMQNTLKFRGQLKALLSEDNRDFLLERIRKGRNYYTAFMEKNLEQVIYHMAEVEQLTRTKTYLNALGDIEQQIMIILDRMAHLEQLTDCILSGREFGKRAAASREILEIRRQIRKEAIDAAENNPKFRSSKTGKKRKKGAKMAKGQSEKLSWAMAAEGKSIAEIAKERSLTPSTIEGHLAKGILAGEVDIFQVLRKKQVEHISSALSKANTTFNEAHRLLGGKYTHGELRMVQAYLTVKRSS